MFKTLKNNISLVLGLSIPVLMILFVAASIYLPRLLAPKPKFDFIYEARSGSYYSSDFQYSIKDERLVRNNIKSREVESKLYLHNIIKNESKEISFEDAQKLLLDSKLKSPDGYEVVGANSTNGRPTFFSVYNYDDQYLVGHNVNTKINLPGSNSSDSGSYKFHFLGWVK